MGMVIAPPFIRQWKDYMRSWVKYWLVARDQKKHHYYITSINMLLVVMEKVLMKALKDRWELDGEHEGRGCRTEDSDREVNALSNQMGLGSNPKPTTQ